MIIIFKLFLDKARTKLKTIPDFIPTLCKVLTLEDTICIQNVSETVSKLSEDVVILQDLIKNGIINAFGTALENKSLSPLILAFTRCIQEGNSCFYISKL